uniref:MFS transporter n=1 Tax=Cupriavidus yeoncheonensis TaxID=1462994 RepID=UPI003F49B1F9
MNQPSATRLAVYGLLGLPLAMAALPVYIQAPAYYTSRLGMSLSVAGIVLFAARLVDTAQDPFLGWWVDRLARRNLLHRAMWLGAVLLAVAFTALWLPPVSGDLWLAAWLAASLTLVYLAHSLINVAYLAWGVRLGDERTLARAAAWREGAGLIGVLLASALPAWLLAPRSVTPRVAMTVFASLFAVLLITALWLLLRIAPHWRPPPLAGPATGRPTWKTLRNNHAFRALLLPYFLNSLSVALPATLAVFFIEDVLAAPKWVAPCLTLYFVAGAVGLPGWVHVSRRIGPMHAWRMGMLLAAVAFVWAGLLGPGNVLPFLLVCALSGLALGADLALPPVLLAARIPAIEGPAIYYGVWTLIGKLCLAIAGLALPALAWLDYQPGTPAIGSAGHALAWMYAGVPCLLKLGAMFMLRADPHASPEPSR